MAARAQFAITISFHIVLAAFTLGLAHFLMVLEALWLWRGRRLYLDVYCYWLKIFPLTWRRVLSRRLTTADQRLVRVAFKKCNHHLHSHSRGRNVTAPTGGRSQPATALVVKSAFEVPGELDLDPAELIALDLFVCQSSDHSSLVAGHPRLLVGQRRPIEHVPRKNHKAVAVALMKVILVVRVATGDVLVQYLGLPAFVDDLS